MKNLHYTIPGGLSQAETGPEAQVGDQVRLYLDTEANPGFPEYIVGVIQQPITKSQCEGTVSYVIEYNPADLDGAASLIRQGDVVDAVVITAVDALLVYVDTKFIPLTGTTIPVNGTTPAAFVGQQYISTINGFEDIWEATSATPSRWVPITGPLLKNRDTGLWERLVVLAGTIQSVDL